MKLTLEHCFKPGHSRTRIRALLGDLLGRALGLSALVLLVVLPAWAADPVSLSTQNLAYATAWQQNQANPEVDTFNSWIGQFNSAALATARSQMVGEGIRLARQRHATFLKLLKSAPEKALAATIPDQLRQALPAEVSAELETRVSGIGDLTVNIFCQAKDGAPIPEPIQRFVTLNGVKYRAYVYGRRLSQNSKKGIPLHGIVLDGVIALHESALRELESGEVPSPAKPVVDLRTAAQQAQGATAVSAEMGGKIYQFGSAAALRDAELKLEDAETGVSPIPTQSAGAILEQSSNSNPQPLGTGPAGAPPTAWTTGFKSILIIRVDFSDLTGDPTYPGGPAETTAYVQNLADTQVAPYYIKSSYGLTSMTNTVTDLLRMPQTAASYATSGNNDQLHLDAETLAAATYNLTNYDRIIVLFSSLGALPGSLITYGGLANVSGPSVWVNGEFDFRVVAHELGHTYGLYHAALWQVTDGNPISPNGSAIEYGDDFDTMGANFANDPNTDFSVFNKNTMGWIADHQIQTVAANANTVVRVSAFDWANSQNGTNAAILGVKYVKDFSRTYWISARRNFTSNFSMQNGAYVIWSYNTVGGGSGGGYDTALLDMTTPGLAPSGGVNSDYDSALSLDSTFTDPAANLILDPINEGGVLPNGFLDLQFGTGLPQGPNIVIVTNFISGGNGNGVIDFDECNNLNLVLANVSGADATHVSATLSTTTPGVTIAQSASAYPDLPIGASGTNLAPFKISTAPDFICGRPINLSLLIKCDQSTILRRFTLRTGTPGKSVRYDNNNFVFIPDLGEGDSSIVVSNLDTAINKVTVSLHLTHTFDADLLLQLVAPDGSTCTLSANNGSFGQNYGIACSPDAQRTTFDDAAPNSISSGIAPFIGTFRPQTPLSVFNGKSGTSINGAWTLRAIDQFGGDFGFLQCWSLVLTPTACDDGGGACPGSDLALGLTAQPEPVLVGNNLIYTIGVTNFGPSAAKNVTVSQLLPASGVFISAAPSQGNFSFAGGVLTCSLGAMNPGGRASISVVVVPAAVGAFISTATVSSEQPDPDLSNNSATVASTVNAPTADLGVGLSATPPNVVLGSPLTYTASVTNNGPQIASGVTVANNLPSSVTILSAVSSQGTVTISNSLVMAVLGTLTNGSRATVTITTIPLAEGVIVASSSVSGNQIDPTPGNNTAVLSLAVGPADDLGVSITDFPDPVVLLSNLTYTVIVTNRGPGTATAASAAISLASSVNILTVSSSQGTITQQANNNVSAFLGTLNNGASATITIVVKPTHSGPVSASVLVSSAQTDANPADNTANTSALVSLPFISIVPAGTALKTEGFLPPNGAIDNGETVTITLGLRNAGNVDNTNLTATLLATNGVTPLGTSNSQNYGILQHSGPPLFKDFTFRASGAPGATITAVLRLTDGPNAITNPVTFSFTLPNTFDFANSASIAIRDNTNALPYPSVITVPSLNGTLSKVTATLSNFNHTFPKDVSVLLVGPTGLKSLLMSHAGDQPVFSNSPITLTFDDSAPNGPVPASGQLLTGAWQPAAYAPAPIFLAPAPAGPYVVPLSSFNGVSTAGAWSLYVIDDSKGDFGSIANGWRLALTTISPVNQLADLSLSVSGPPSPSLVADPLTYTFTVTNAGPNNASFVSFTNTLPANAAVISITNSQGNVFQAGSVIIGNLGPLNAGATATITVVLAASSAGAFADSAVVSGFETDLNPANNTVGMVTAILLPQVSLSLGQSSAPDPVVVGYNLTNTISITNDGPNTALNLVLTDPLPAGATFVSADSSAGFATNNAGVVVCNLGNLPAGGSATFTVVMAPSLVGTITNTVVATTGSTNANYAARVSTVVTTVLPPAPQIIAGGQVLTSESGPVNGAVDSGETVTVALALVNIGSADTASVIATLQNSGGVTPSAGSQTRSYGALLHGGPAVTNAFTFTASGSIGGTVIASLQLIDGSNDLGTVTFPFALPGRASFSNVVAIVIPDHGPATPYPSTINVSGMGGLVSRVTATLNGLTHSFPHDINALLVGPSGASVTLMSHSGGGYSLTNVTLTFDDFAPAVLPSSAQIVNGTFRPTQYTGPVALVTPAPPLPFGSSLAALNGGSPNGNWSLYVLDDSAGDSGFISGGWSFEVTTVNPVNPVADLALSLSSSANTLYLGESLTNSVLISNLGPNAATDVVITHILPPGAIFVAALPQGISTGSSNGLVLCHLGDLPSGASSNVTIITTVNLSGSILNTVSVAADQYDINLANNSAQTSATVLIPSTPGLIAQVANGRLELTVTNAQPGLTYLIQASTNLTSWVAVMTNIPDASGTIKFVDPNFSNLSYQFYRSVRVVP